MNTLKNFSIYLEEALIFSKEKIKNKNFKIDSFDSPFKNLDNFLNVLSGLIFLNFNYNTYYFSELSNLSQKQKNHLKKIEKHLNSVSKKNLNFIGEKTSKNDLIKEINVFLLSVFKEEPLISFDRDIEIFNSFCFYCNSKAINDFSYNGDNGTKELHPLGVFFMTAIFGYINNEEIREQLTSLKFLERDFLKIYGLDLDTIKKSFSVLQKQDFISVFTKNKIKEEELNLWFDFLDKIPKEIEKNKLSLVVRSDEKEVFPDDDVFRNNKANSFRF